MKIAELHSWPNDHKAALQIQKDLSSEIITRAESSIKPRIVVGVDVSSVRGNTRLWAAVVAIHLPELKIVEEAFATIEAGYPYIPGLLSFREIPVLIEAMRNLTSKPDLVICDGQGIAHPRFFGLASHLGLWLNVPTIGCAKSLLVGEAAEPGIHAGDWQPLKYKNRTVGGILRTRKGCKPMYVSPGHMIDVDRSISLVQATNKGYRLPEPTRLAHLAVTRYRLSFSE
ncbi:endonuclease V [candidate division LCP-89 bacterium B3_LCP]|uniref:Endonuclease V n=1 Tax=candidate division LCP-89 bacterium B3_LCP TaxID=2012998 RepID=A0A532UPV7_UNCL8|nr:MAG: endonuclease V [candidate division LCP-89 bacterium B3_LCP]